MAWLHLFVAILFEVAGTVALKASNGLTRPAPAAVTVAGYAISFYFMGLALRTIPLGLAYAVWSGAGIATLAVLGALASVTVFKLMELPVPAIGPARRS